MSFNKKEYQRAYMRKKREKNLSGEGSTQPLPGAAGVAKTEASAITLSEAQGNAAQNNLPVPVLAGSESEEAVTGGVTLPNPKPAEASSEARESTQDRPPLPVPPETDSHGAPYVERLVYILPLSSLSGGRGSFPEAYWTGLRYGVTVGHERKALRYEV